MYPESNSSFTRKELVGVMFFSIILLSILLYIANYIGYDLFWEQLGAALVLYLTILSAISSIVRKRIPTLNFFQMFTICTIVVFSFTALTKPEQGPLVIDNFETGIAGWFRNTPEGVTSTITEQTRLSPEGSWHMEWRVENIDPDTSRNWAAIVNCLPGPFPLKNYEKISFWYRTKSDELGFQLEIRCPDDQNAWNLPIGPSVKWREEVLRLPREKDVAGWTIVGNPNPEVCVIAFTNDCDNIYHFDNLKLIPVTYKEQIGILTLLGIDVTIVLLVLFSMVISKRYS